MGLRLSDGNPYSGASKIQKNWLKQQMEGCLHITPCFLIFVKEYEFPLHFWQQFAHVNRGTRTELSGNNESA